MVLIIRAGKLNKIKEVLCDKCREQVCFAHREYYVCHKCNANWLAKHSISNPHGNWKVPKDFVCPACDAPRWMLLHRRKNGEWFTGIEVHHFGKGKSNTSEYYEKEALLCYRCNVKEKDIRVFLNRDFPLSPDELHEFFIKYPNLKPIHKLKPEVCRANPQEVV